MAQQVYRSCSRYLFGFIIEYRDTAIGIDSNDSSRQILEKCFVVDLRVLDLRKQLSVVDRDGELPAEDLQGVLLDTAINPSRESGAEKHDAQYVVVKVQDSGPGIAPQQQDRLFEAFYSTKPGGLGMGLAICRSIVEAHGGRLWATANEDRGAAFHFTLPIKEERSA